MEFNNLEAVMTKYAKYVIQQSRSNLTKDDKGSGNLYNWDHWSDHESKIPRRPYKCGLERSYC